MGFGGFFMHSRVGLKTEYLSKRWFDCIKLSIDAAKKLGMTPWLYDEDRWPSGAAGSIVTKEDRFKMRSLFAQQLTASDAAATDLPGHTVAWFAADLDAQERRLRSYRRIDAPDAVLAPGESLLRIYWQLNEKSSWFNGETYLDTMNPEAVQRFVEVTHEHYLGEIGEHFGSTIPGIFTDEPCYAHFVTMGLPWTERLPQAFLDEYGYDLTDTLPELFYHTPDAVSQTRWAFYNVATKLFVDAFSRTISNWCEENNLRLTGHVLGEDSLLSQTACSGAVMRFYEFMQQPGIDLLTEHWNIFTTTKQCTSAARQFGQKYRLSEIYGCTGWDFSFAGHKALGDWQYALGINFLCPHLAWYSMQGEAKRDYPASISAHSPWFKQYRCVTDYFGRIGAVLVGGNEIRDLLVIHPVESYWSQHLPHPEVIPADRPANNLLFEQLTAKLLAENLDFDYGDEDHLARFGSARGDALSLGLATYRQVLIPEMATIRSTTLKLLQAFAAKGGKVCYQGTPPEFVDGKRSTLAQEIYREAFTPYTLEVLEFSRRVSITDAQGHQIRPLLYNLASHYGYHSLFVCNHGAEFADDMLSERHIRNRTLTFDTADVAFKLDDAGAVYELNPEDGTVRAVKYTYQNGCYHFRTSFGKLQSRLYVITDTPPEGCQPEAANAAVVSATIPVDAANWRYRLSEPNVMILDHARYAIDGEELGQAYILNIDDILRHRLGACLRGEAMLQPYLGNQDGMDKSVPLNLRYTFQCEHLPTECQLVLETPEFYEVILNGQPLPTAPTGWWVDTALKTIAIPPGFLRIGENTLQLSCQYSAAMPGLEYVYLLGDFGVRNDVMTALPETLAAGDWTTQGLPYYSGNLTYQIPLSELPSGRLALRLPDCHQACVGVRVNGGPETLLPWEPYQLEISDLVKRDGADFLEVTIYGNRRNSFGPFYLKDMWPVWVGARFFKMQETSTRQSAPQGLNCQPQIVVLQ